MKQIWTKDIALYLFIFSLLSFIVPIISFYNYVIGIQWVIFHLFVVLFFAIGSLFFYNSTKYLSETKFIKNVFLWSMIIKIIIVFFNYYCFEIVNGFPFIIHSDPYAYNKYGELAAYDLSRHIFNPLQIFFGADISDMGGYFYYGIIYYLFGWLGNNIIVARIINSLFATLTVIYFYKIIRFANTKDVARSSAILFMFFPLFNLYAGTHYKESVFLYVVIVASYESYKVFFDRQFGKWNVFWLVATLMISLFFRMVIGPVIIFGMAGLIFFNRQKKVSVRFRLSLAVIFVFLLVAYSNFFLKPTERFISGAKTYSERVVAQTQRNKAGKFAFGDLFSTPVLYVAPIFGPLPSIVVDRTLKKDFAFALSALISTLFVKIFLSFWVLFGIYYLMRRGFRANSYILLFFISYYIIIGFSGNGFIIRYLMPIIPFFIYFAVVGLKQYKRYIPYFFLFLLLMVAVILFFNYKKVQIIGI